MTLETSIVVVAVLAILSLIIWKRDMLVKAIERSVGFLRRIGNFMQRQYQKLILGLAWFAGADVSVLKGMPSSVKEKRAGFGFTMFMAVAVSAFIAASVWIDIMDSYLAGFFIGVLWFLIIWAIDRSIMAFMDHDKPGRSAGKITVVTARIILVVGISYLNSTIAQMKIFDPEIKQMIAEKKHDKITNLNDSITNSNLPLENEKRELADNFDQKRGDYENWVALQQSQISAQRDSLRKREDLWIKEIEGLVGSGIRGYGPAAKAKREAITQDSIRLAEAILDFENKKLQSPEYLAIADAKNRQERRTTEINALLAKTEKFRLERIEKINSEKADGLSHRYDALKEVAKQSLLVWAVFILFLMFESLAIILKMMMGRDEYDEHIRLQREDFVSEKQDAVTQKIQKARDAFAVSMNDLAEARAKNQAKTTGVIMLQENVRLSHERSRLQSFKDHLDQLDVMFEDMKTPASERARIVEETMKAYKPIMVAPVSLN